MQEIVDDTAVDTAQFVTVPAAADLLGFTDQGAFRNAGRSAVVFRIGTPGQARERWSGAAYWSTSWPFAEYVKHAWAGAWVCSAFRNEGAGLSSDLIRQAVAATRYVAAVEPSWEAGRVPELGMVSFVNEAKTSRGRSRRSRPGECFLRAGFKAVGHTKGGLIALQLEPDDMPEPAAPAGYQLAFAAAADSS